MKFFSQQELNTRQMNLSFPLPNKLCDVYIMWHKSLVGISEICLTACLSEGKRKAHEDSPQMLCQVASATIVHRHETTFFGAIDVPSFTYLERRA